MVTIRMGEIGLSQASPEVWIADVAGAVKLSLNSERQVITRLSACCLEELRFYWHQERMSVRCPQCQSLQDPNFMLYDMDEWEDLEEFFETLGFDVLSSSVLVKDLQSAYASALAPSPRKNI